MSSDAEARTFSVKWVFLSVPDRRIELTEHVPAGLPFAIGDSTQLQQVFVNLCLNARDAVKERDDEPRVGIAASLEIFGAGEGRHPGAHHGSYIRVQVTDNGSGMDAETRRRVFEPFFTTKEVGKGTGLGLSTAYAIVEAHGGWIECDSEPGAGTTFTVYLPAGEPEVGQEPEEDAEPSHLRGTETILVIDDDEPVRETVSAMLERAGYSVITAAEGGEGLELFQEHRERIELVLLDLSMPGMSGRQILKKLRAIDPESRVAYFTGRVLSEDERSEVQVIVEKPVTWQGLISAVQAGLQS